MPEIRLDLDEADGGLPDVCMRCGEQSTVVKSRTMSWCPPWVGVLILAGALPYVIVAMIMTRRAKVQVPLCDDHSGHWLYRNLIIWGGFGLMAALGAVLIAVLIATNRPGGGNDIGGFLCFGGFIVFLAWLVVIIIAQNTAIRPKEITDRHIILQGVSDAFVDAVEDSDRSRYGRRRKPKALDDYDDDEPRPRKKSASSDAIKEGRRRRDDDDEDEPRPRKKRQSEDFEE